MAFGGGGGTVVMFDVDGEVTFVVFDDGGEVTFVVFDADGEVTFVVFDADGEVTFVVFDADGGGLSSGGGLGGGGQIQSHALGGPSVDGDASERVHDASHADAALNIPPMSVTELVSHPEMSALNLDAPENIDPMFRVLSCRTT